NFAWVFVSSDGGSTWSRNIPPVGGDKSTWQIAASPAYATDRTLFVVSNSGLFKSTDGGATWPLQQFANSGTFSSVAVSPGYPTDLTVLAASYSTGVYKSTNGGASFTPSSTGLPAGISVYGLVMSPNFTVDQTVFLDSAS